MGVDLKLIWQGLEELLREYILSFNKEVVAVNNL